MHAPPQAQPKTGDRQPAGGQPPSVMAPVRRVLRSAGEPLGPATRGFMEARFRHDFGAIRVHSDKPADEAARAVDGLAFTVGRHVVFRAGQHAPATEAGRALLAHELSHSLQQRSGADIGPLDVLDVASPLERGADETARQALSGDNAGTIPAVGAAPVVARKVPPKQAPKPAKVSQEEKIDSGTMTLDAAFELVPGSLAVEVPPGTLVALRHHRTVSITTENGDRARLEITAESDLPDDVRSKEAALLTSGTSSLRYRIEVKYADKDFGHWHVPAGGEDHVFQHDTPLLLLAAAREPKFVWFGLSKRHQYEAMAEFVAKSAALEVPRYHRTLEAEKEKRRAEQRRAEQDRMREAERRIREASEPSKVEVAAEIAVDLATDFIPGVSNLKDAIIAATGINPVTGQKVPWPFRILAGILAIPGLGNVLKWVGKGLIAVAEGIAAVGRRAARFIEPFTEWLGSVWRRTIGRLGGRAQRQLGRAGATAVEHISMTGAEMGPFLLDLWQREPILQRLNQAQHAAGAARHQELIHILADFERETGVTVQRVGRGEVEAARGPGNFASLRSRPGYLQIEEQVFQDTDQLMLEMRHELSFHYTGGPNVVPTLGESGMHAYNILEHAIATDGEATLLDWAQGFAE